LAHPAGVAVEAELGAVMGHEDGAPPPYEEMFTSGRGFTDVAECARFVRESGCDWLSVAVGSIHGAISTALRDQAKVEARLDLAHLQRLHEAAGASRWYCTAAQGLARVCVKRHQTWDYQS